MAARRSRRNAPQEATQLTETEEVADVTSDNTTEKDSTMAESNGTIEFVDELPKVTRKADGGVWAERLAPLRDNPMRWAKVQGPTKNPHAVVANVTSGKAAGVPDVDRFEFAGRNIDTGRTEEVTDEETGETKTVPVKEGYVFARFMDDERYAERQEELATKRAKRAEREAANA